MFILSMARFGYECVEKSNNFLGNAGVFSDQKGLALKREKLFETPLIRTAVNETKHLTFSVLNRTFEDCRSVLSISSCHLSLSW